MLSQNKAAVPFPSRIVCLSYDVVEMLCGIGCGGKIAGKPDGTVIPGTEQAISIGGFGRPDIDIIKALKPDLVIGYSEVCAGVMARLILQNITAIALQHTSLEEIYASIILLGRLTGNITEAAALADNMRRKLRELAAYIPKNARRPVVYFEEWNKPYVCGTQWVSEVITIAGGKDAFADRSRAKKYLAREVTAYDAAAAAPEIILASWCGKPVDISSFKKRPGWESVPAVKTGRIYEIPGELILRPGPSLIEGARYISDIINLKAG
jgi:iron complex transport system substrate-binding protein